MAGPVTTAVAGRIHKRMQGGPGGKTFDPTIIIAIIQQIFTMFASGCKVPAKTAKSISVEVATKTGFGHRLFTLWFSQVVTANAPDGDAPEYEAAILDEVGPTTENEYGAMIAEAPPKTP